jgi:hypothetical protein
MHRNIKYIGEVERLDVEITSLELQGWINLGIGSQNRESGAKSDLLSHPGINAPTSGKV